MSQYYQFYANGVGCGGANIAYAKFLIDEELEFINNVYNEWLEEANDINMITETYCKPISKDEINFEFGVYYYSD